MKRYIWLVCIQGKMVSKHKLKELKARLKENLTLEEKANVYGEIGREHESSRNYWRAKRNYMKAGDYASLARVYEAQGKLRHAAEIWDDLGTKLTLECKTEEDRERTAERRKGYYERAVKLFVAAAGVKDASAFDPINERTYDQQAFYATLGLRDAEFDALPPAEKRKIREKRRKLHKLQDEEYRSSNNGDETDAYMSSYNTYTSLYDSLYYSLFIGIAIIIAFFLLSSNITGFTIYNLNKATTNSLGIFLLMAFLIGALLVSRKPKHNKGRKKK